MRALLDVNVLIALLDTGHVHHQLATDWLASNLKHGWASCPITQNGCIRIMSQSAYPHPAAPGIVADRLRDAMQARHHQFWPDDVNAVQSETIDWSVVLTSRQMTDAYLLALAVRHSGRFVTLDRGVPLAAVAAASAKALLRLV